MNTEDQIYRDLQKHLDKGPVGYPAQKSGQEIIFLKHFFTPEEAKIAVHLSRLKVEPIERIYKRVKKSGMSISLEELQKILDKMAYKGTILVYQEGYGEKRYKNAGVDDGGMYDFQVGRLTKGIVDDFFKFKEERAKIEAGIKKKFPLLRTVPVEKSIPLPDKHQFRSYESVRQIVENSPGPIAVAHCICRESKDMVGESCKHTDLRETCLQFGSDHAQQYIDMGIGRAITKEEALEILDKAQEAGLILQPENSLRPEAICCCCGDCCGVIGAAKGHPRWADFYATNYYAEVDPELCQGCGTCVKRCQMEALSIVDGIAVVNLDRCIGCGNCVVSCEEKAMHLHKKEKELVLPKDKDAMFMKLISTKVGKWTMFKMRMRMLLGLKS
jgi:electron transport complex protein RnfB